MLRHHAGGSPRDPSRTVAGRGRCLPPPRRLHRPRPPNRSASAISARSPASSPRPARTCSTGSSCRSSRSDYQAGGRKIELIEEDTEGNSATAHRQVPQARRPRQDPRAHRRAAGQRGQQPGAAHRAGPAPDPVPHHARRPHQAQDRQVDPPLQLLARARSCTRSATTRRRPSSTSGWRPSRWTTASATRRLAASSGCSRTRAAGWCRRSGCRSTRSTSRRTSRRWPTDVDAVCAVFVAGQAVRFVKQYGESRAQGQDPAHRHRGHDRRERAARHGRRGGRHHRHAPLEPHAADPGQPDLHEARRGASSDAPPPTSTRSCTAAGRWITEAANALNGKVEDREKLVAAIRRAIETTADPRGPIKLDEWGNPTRERLRPAGRAGRRQARQHRDPHLPDGLAVLDLQAGGVPESPAYDRNYPPVKP